VLEPASNETVEKVQLWAFHRKVPLENKGVMGTDFFGFRVFRQSQQGHAGDGEQRPLVPRIVEAILLRWYHKNTRLVDRLKISAVGLVCVSNNPCQQSVSA
jgi:hypothetical protein